MFGNKTIPNWFQALVQKERDTLLAEKEAWAKSATPSTAEGTLSQSQEEGKAKSDEMIAGYRVSRPWFS